MDGHKIYGHDRLEGGREGGCGERLINLSVCIKTVVAQEEAKDSVSIYIYLWNRKVPYPLLLQLKTWKWKPEAEKQRKEGGEYLVEINLGI